MFRQKMLDILQQEIDGNWIIPCHFGLSIPEVHTQTFIVRSLVVFVWFVVVFCSQTSLTKENHSSLNMVVVQGLCRLCVSVQDKTNRPLKHTTSKSKREILIISTCLWVWGYGFAVCSRNLLEFSSSHVTSRSTGQKTVNQSMKQSIDRSINQSSHQSFIESFALNVRK